MSYLLLDDQYPGHAKLVGLPPQAKWLHTCALVHCAEKLTDGRITRHALAVIGATAEVPRPDKYVPLFVERSLWVPDGDWWMIHDYLEHNPSAAEVEEKRRQAKERQARWRDSHRGSDGRFTRDETRDVTRYETPPHPIPLPSPESVSSLHAVTSYEGEISETPTSSFALEQIIELCGSANDAREKLTRTAAKYRAPEARLVAILWAISQPDTRDRLGKALAMMKREAA